MEIEQLLDNFKNGAITREKLLQEIKLFSYEDLGYAKVDHHRKLRNGVAEVIYCPGKQPEQILGIVRSFAARGSENIVLSRADETVYQWVSNEFPETEYEKLARLAVVNRKPFLKENGSVCVVSAGTADIPVAKEASCMCEILGNRTHEVFDVGVAGIHRLLSKRGEIAEADVIIVVAGMDGALASVVGGLFSQPVIAVPTSVGYGVSEGGKAALHSMLSSCASGISVVNIDNGFGAACMANRILDLLNPKKCPEGEE